MHIGIQFLKFGMVGGCGTAAHYLMFAVLVNVLNIGAVVASIVGSITGAIVNYLGNYYFAFQTNQSHWEAGSKFYIGALLSILLNATLVGAFVKGAGWGAWISQLLATVICLMVNFMLARLWVFKKKTEKK